MIISNHNVCRMCLNYSEIKLVSGVCRLEEQMEKLSLRSDHFVQTNTIAKQVISRR